MLIGIPLLVLIATSILLIVVLTAKFKVHPFLALIIATLYLGVLAGLPLIRILEAMKSGFGNLMAYIGMIVVFGSVIGVYLERSGGALSIAQRLIDMIGQRRIVPGISSIGALVSIPVFCDSGFILLAGLTDKLAALSKESKATLSLALGTGLYTTHTLIPPTPGPIAVAGNIEATQYLGTIIITGFLISIPVLLITQCGARRLSKGIQVHQSTTTPPESSNTASISTWKALLPLLLPIGLIASGTVIRFLGIENELIDFISAPLIAVLIGALLAIGLLGQKKQNTAWMTAAIQVSGPILIITGAGGAFGGVLKATPIQDIVAIWIQGDHSALVILVILFVIAAVLKTAQGSSTSAMVITSSLLAPIIPGLGWEDPLQYAFAVMAIGGGAMTVSHFNDSYFWVVSQFSGISAKDTARSFTVLTAIQGISVLVFTIMGWMIFIG